MHVTNAMPPYLIANERISPFPFSASNTSSLKVGLDESIDPLQEANATQQSHLLLENQDLEFLLPNNRDLTPSTDLCLAYQPGADASTIGPIILSTPQHYAANETGSVTPNATCWEILTLRLGRFARQHIEKHGAQSLTDKMLQDEARVILYGEADGWEQTAADNDEWLKLFKKAHGIGTNLPTESMYSSLLFDFITLA